MSNWALWPLTFWTANPRWPLTCPHTHHTHRRHIRPLARFPTAIAQGLSLAGKILEKTHLWMLCPLLPGGGGCPRFLGSSSGALTPQPGVCAQLSVPGSNVFSFLPNLPSVSFSDSCPAHLGFPGRCSHTSWAVWPSCASQPPRVNELLLLCSA